MKTAERASRGHQKSTQPLEGAQETSLRKCHPLRPARLNCPWVDKGSSRGEGEEAEQSRAEGAAYLTAKRPESAWLEDAGAGVESAIAGETGRV